jgi:hypothetical protein
MVRIALVTEADYFLYLQFRTSSELAGMRERKLQYFWCDGFISEDFDAASGRPRISGRVWLACDRWEQECWDFVLLLEGGVRDRDQIDWEKMLPAKDFTGWLALDFHAKTMKVDPLVAYPDSTAVE